MHTITSTVKIRKPNLAGQVTNQSTKKETKHEKL